MRLRPLTEAECYARCYGGRSEEAAAPVWFDAASDGPDEHRPEDGRREARPAEPTEGREAA